MCVFVWVSECVGFGPKRTLNPGSGQPRGLLAQRSHDARRQHPGLPSPGIYMANLVRFARQSLVAN